MFTSSSRAILVGPGALRMLIALKVLRASRVASTCLLKAASDGVLETVVLDGESDMGTK